MQEQPAGQQQAIAALARRGHPLIAEVAPGHTQSGSHARRAAGCRALGAAGPAYKPREATDRCEPRSALSSNPPRRPPPLHRSGHHHFRQLGIPSLSAPASPSASPDSAERSKAPSPSSCSDRAARSQRPEHQQRIQIEVLAAYRGPLQDALCRSARQRRKRSATKRCRSRLLAWLSSDPAAAADRTAASAARSGRLVIGDIGQ